jgi:phosphatidate cytidylyltransferase
VLKARLLTAAIALPILLAAIVCLPNWAWSLLIAVIGLIAISEIWSMNKFRGQLANVLLIANVVLLLALLPIGHGPTPASIGSDPRSWVRMMAVVLFAWGQFLVVDVSLHELPPPGPTTVLGSGLISVAVSFPYFAWVRNEPNGVPLLLLMLALVIVTDSAAYFVGRAIGKHKLAVRVSPGKTIEGAIGGIGGCVLAGVILRPWMVPEWSVSRMALYAAIVAVLAIVGDLANSAYKRIAGVKDSGWIFPGHGGLLDRTCSLVWAAVLTYYYAH